MKEVTQSNMGYLFFSTTDRFWMMDHGFINQSFPFKYQDGDLAEYQWDNKITIFNWINSSSSKEKSYTKLQ